MTEPTNIRSIATDYPARIQLLLPITLQRSISSLTISRLQTTTKLPRLIARHGKIEVMTEKSFGYAIDVIEGCNLRCPSCPVGNFREAARPKGRMSVTMLEAIMGKIQRETPNVQWIGLFSWAEPLLHPEIARLVKVVKEHRFRCHLSSNLNRIDRLEEVIAAGPDHLRISISGFTQEVYEQTHRGGYVEAVKSNMLRLRQILNEQNSQTDVAIAWHRYRHNREDEKQMTRFAQQLGFRMEPVWAYLMPLEKNLEFHQGIIKEEDKKVIELMALTPKEQKEIQTGTPQSDCLLRSEQFSINADGSVALCCGAFDKSNFIAESFLDTPHEELQRRKYAHATCFACMNHEIHKTAIMQNREAIDERAYHNLGVKLPLKRQLQKGTRRVISTLRQRAALGTRYQAIRRVVSGR